MAATAVLVVALAACASPGARAPGLVATSATRGLRRATALMERSDREVLRANAPSGAYVYGGARPRAVFFVRTRAYGDEVFHVVYDARRMTPSQWDACRDALLHRIGVHVALCDRDASKRLLSSIAPHDDERPVTPSRTAA